MTLSRISGFASAIALGMVVIGAFGGALAGLVLASVLTSQVWLAIVAAFVAVVLALIVQHVVLGSHLQFAFPPALTVLHVAVASLLGGLAGHELAVDLTEPPPSPLIGGLAGVLASVLISSFVITIMFLTTRQLRD
jgi:hypothetical protein